MARKTVHGPVVEPRLMNTAEVARLAGVSARTIRRWVELGENGFPEPSIGRYQKHKRWHSQTISDWLESKRM